MAFSIRSACQTDAERLPEIERSSGKAFRSLPELAWIADDDVLSASAQATLILKGGVWVAEDDAAEIVGFLSAERIDDELHVWGLAVDYSHQRQGLRRRLV